MIDLLLRFADEATAAAVMADGYSPSDGLLVDIVGIVWRPTGEVNASGDPVFEARPGWHINVRCLDDRDLSALTPYVITPAEPYRVWA